MYSARRFSKITSAKGSLDATMPCSSKASAISSADLAYIVLLYLLSPGIKVTGGYPYNVIIGAGGFANPTSSGFGNQGGHGGDTQFEYPTGSVTIIAKGGKGGWGAQTPLNDRNGWGGGQDGGGNTNRDNDYSYDITDVNYWASFYSGKPSHISF